MVVAEERERKGEIIVKTYRSGFVCLGRKVCKLTDKGAEVVECVKYLACRAQKASEIQFDAYIEAVCEFEGSVSDLQEKISKISTAAYYKTLIAEGGTKRYEAKYRAAHREDLKQKWKNWYDKNREKRSAYIKERRRKKKLEKARELERRLEK